MAIIYQKQLNVVDKVRGSNVAIISALLFSLLYIKCEHYPLVSLRPSKHFMNKNCTRGQATVLVVLL